jgi:hypothetical protein
MPTHLEIRAAFELLNWAAPFHAPPCRPLFVAWRDARRVKHHPQHLTCPCLVCICPCLLQDRGGAASLESYLRRPAAAYAELSPDMILPTSPSSFLLTLPRISVSPDGEAEALLSASDGGIQFIAT